MGGGRRRGCSGPPKPFAARRALALVILVYSPTEPPRGLWKRPSLPPSPLLRAWPVDWGAGLDVLSEGSGGPDPAAPEAPAEPENLPWVMGRRALGDAGPAPSRFSLQEELSTRTLQVWKKQTGHNHLDKNYARSHQNPMHGQEGFHPAMIPAPKPLASSRRSRLWLT